MRVVAIASICFSLLMMGMSILQQRHIAALEAEIGVLQKTLATLSKPEPGLLRSGNANPRSRTRLLAIQPLATGDSGRSKPSITDVRVADTNMQSTTAPKPAAPKSPPPKAPVPLSPQRRQVLLEGREFFNPGPIEPSPYPVGPNAVLQTGQALQINYNGTWYAGEVVGMAEDGGIHVRYFGWDSHWDEVVPRSDLRIDPQAKEKAVKQYGK